jgi:hypothetical protein
LQKSAASRSAYCCTAVIRLATHEGDIQCVVRACTDADLRRQWADGCQYAPAVGRLDAHERRSGRAGATLYQMGQPACVAARGRGSHAARGADRADTTLRTDLCGLRCGTAGSEARCASSDAGCDAVEAAASRVSGAQVVRAAASVL